MQIFVRLLTGRTISLDIEQQATVRELKQRIEKEEGTPQGDQTLTYAGKQLLDERTLEYHRIQEWATLHLMRLRDDFDDDGGDLSLPNPEVTKNHKITDDEYVLNPQLHYSKLHGLQFYVEGQSELRRCGGKYRLADREILGNDSRIMLCPEPIKQFLQSNKFDLRAGVGTISLLDRIQEPLASPVFMRFSKSSTTSSLMLQLTTAYLALLQVRKSSEVLKDNSFCGEYFSIIVESAKTPSVAKVHPVYGTDIDTLLLTFEDLLLDYSKRTEAHEEIVVSSDKLEYLSNVASNFLRTIGFSDQAQPNCYEANTLCTSLVSILDIGLVSYVGSHGTESTFCFHGLRRTPPRSFALSQNVSLLPRGFACLNGFFQQDIWVFSTQPGKEAPKLSSYEARLPPERRLETSTSVSMGTSTTTAPSRDFTGQNFLLQTRMDTFADLWGPVWTMTCSDRKGRSIMQYNLSVGSIRKTGNTGQGVTDAAVLCHWSSTQDLTPKRSDANSKNMLKPDDVLLIGATRVLEEYQECDETLESFERKHGIDMTPLGTCNERWYLDSRTLAISGSFNVGITIQGTQKLTPRTTLKQHILAQWKNSPSNAPPQTLSQMTGLEISLCTGNARRIRLGELFLVESVQEIIESAFPGWLSSYHGNYFLESLRCGQFEQFWLNDTSRTTTAKVVAFLLDMLDKTGITENSFQLTAAFLHGSRQAAIKYATKSNEWTRILKDSSTTAVYALGTATCLCCRAQSTNIMTHESKMAFTALETLVSIREAQADRLSIWLLNGNESLEFEKDENLKGLKADTVVLTQPRRDSLFSGRVNVRRARLGIVGYTACEVLHEDHLGGKHYRALIRAQHPTTRPQQYEQKATIYKFGWRRRPKLANQPDPSIELVSATQSFTTTGASAGLPLTSQVATTTQSLDTPWGSPSTLNAGDIDSNASLSALSTFPSADSNFSRPPTISAAGSDDISP